MHEIINLKHKSSMLAYGLRGFSPWSLDLVALGMWWQKTSCRIIADEVCHLMAAVEQREIGRAQCPYMQSPYAFLGDVPNGLISFL
jgi:hypothetical protein